MQVFQQIMGLAVLQLVQAQKVALITEVTMFQAVAIAQIGVRTLVIVIDGFVQWTTGTTELVAHHLHHLLVLMIRRQVDSRIQPHQVKGLFPSKYHNVLVIFFLACLNEKIIAENLMKIRLLFHQLFV